MTAKFRLCTSPMHLQEGVCSSRLGGAIEKLCHTALDNNFVPCFLILYVGSPITAMLYILTV